MDNYLDLNGNSSHQYKGRLCDIWYYKPQQTNLNFWLTDSELNPIIPTHNYTIDGTTPEIQEMLSEIEKETEKFKKENSRYLDYSNTSNQKPTTKNENCIQYTPKYPQNHTDTLKPSGGNLTETCDTSHLYGGGATINPTANSSIKGTIRDNNSATVDFVVTKNIGNCEIGNRTRTKYDNNDNKTTNELKVFFRGKFTDNLALTADCRKEDTGKTSYNIGFDYESSNLQINIGLRKPEGEDLTPGINVNYNF